MYHTADFSGTAKMRICLLLALGLTAVAAVPSNPQRIVGGTVTTISQYPSMVALLATYNWSTWWQSCGGALLNSRSVLTAAHCLFGDQTSRWRVRVGSTFANSGGTVHTASTYILHPQYNDVSLDNDIAILRTPSNIAFVNNAVQPGTFAGANYNTGDNAEVWATGWGATSFLGSGSEQLRHVQIWTVNQNTCINRYREVSRVVNENMLCAGWLDVGGRDQCQGDSGGPLYHNGVVVGVCSWGEECALARYPGVNARVSRFAAWIQQNA